MSVEWRWSPGGCGWSAHLGTWTAWIQYEAERNGVGMLVARYGAAEADVFAVAIVGPGQERAERYRLRGALDEVRSKLAAALGRRAAAPPPQRVAPLAKWNGPGSWRPMHAAEAGAD